MNIILTTHGDMCEGMIASYKMIAGESNRIHTVKLTDEGVGVYKEKLHQLIEDLSTQGEVLVLCDILGGTPYNESLMYGLQNPGKINLVSGVNLPMLIELGMMAESESSSEVLAEQAKSIGQDGITIADLDI